jgi:hypothetical protein
MPDAKQLSPGAVVLAGGLSVLALLFYGLQIATLADLASSDAAGNAHAQAYGAIEIIFLWVLLAILMLIAFLKGEIPKPALAAAVVLVPVSGFIMFEVLELLSRPYLPPFRWPLVLPALIPPLVVAYCFWALLPDMRVKIPARIAGGVIWGSVLILCFAIVPFDQTRHTANLRITEALEKYDADLAKVPADAPLWDWVPFFDTRNETKKGEILAHIRTLDRRQTDAELMLDRGDFPLGYIGRLDLTPTPTLCNSARALLRKRVEPLVLKTADSKPYSDVAIAVEEAATAMEWLVGYDCDAGPEAAAWEVMANNYRGTNWDVHRLAEVRDPKQLGHIVRNYPERFSMLTPKAHLRAWLNFADQKEFHDQALAGARKLEHRTADAIEMLKANSEHDAWIALEYLTALDLEATPALCDAALLELHKELSRIARPKPEDPLSYDNLLSRLGTGDQFGAAIWLASHGCDADATLSEAEALIKAYQPSPSGGLMLGRLERLHRKP